MIEKRRMEGEGEVESFLSKDIRGDHVRKTMLTES